MVSEAIPNLAKHYVHLLDSWYQIGWDAQDINRSLMDHFGIPGYDAILITDECFGTYAVAGGSAVYLLYRELPRMLELLKDAQVSESVYAEMEKAVAVIQLREV